LFYYIVIAGKDCVNTAYETTLSQGINYEKKLFWATFGTVILNINHFYQYLLYLSIDYYFLYWQKEIFYNNIIINFLI